MLEINNIYNMDCLDGLKQLSDNSVDSIVTDPPYELGFMGKVWDKTGIAYNIELWKECLRVLKHGGHLLAFGNTRTYHRMVCAIEDAGFEIRDTIQWIYGSGFPKSMDISKAIDKKFGAEREVIGINTNGSGNNGRMCGEEKGCGYKSSIFNITTPSTKWAKQWDGWGTATKPAHEDIIVATKPITIDYILNNSLEEIIKCLKLFALIVEKNFMLNQQDLNVELNIAQWNVEANINLQENFKEVMDIFLLEIQKENIDLNIILSWKNILEESYYLMNKYTIETILKMIIELKTLNYLQFQNILRDIIKVKMLQNGQNVNALIVIRNLIEFTKKLNAILLLFVQENVILKENKENCVNNEPIVVARKPLSEKTVAENVLKWGTGGINIDGCRIPTSDKLGGGMVSKGRPKASEGWDRPWMHDEEITSLKKEESKEKVAKAEQLGRFPANCIFDEEAGKLLDEQSGTSKSSDSVRKNNGKHDNKTFGKYNAIDSYGFNDSGGASRFFYCAKASKSERGDGNFHPTVKPIKLIKYLIKLVTPPNGICLDPFEGSGTHAIACSNLGFNYIGFEMNEEYCEIANKYLRQKGTF